MQIPSANVIPSSLLVEPAADRVPVQTLDQEDFLKLLVAQLTSQDPLNPKTDTEFVAQMTQFTNLEQSRTMQKDLARLLGEQQFLQANALIGRVVEVEDDLGMVSRGAVDAVQVEAGTPRLIVNGLPFGMSALRYIESAAPLPNQ